MPAQHESDPHYWLGYLSSSLNALARNPQLPEPLRTVAKRDLDKFLQSPASCEDLVHMLKNGPRP